MTYVPWSRWCLHGRPRGHVTAGLGEDSPLWGNSAVPGPLLMSLLLLPLLSLLGSLLFPVFGSHPMSPLPETLLRPYCDQDPVLVSFADRHEYDIAPALKKTGYT